VRRRGGHEAGRFAVRRTDEAHAEDFLGGRQGTPDQGDSGGGEERRGAGLQKLAVYTKTKYLPHGRKDVGMWSLPDGDTLHLQGAQFDHHRHDAGADPPTGPVGSGTHRRPDAGDREKARLQRSEILQQGGGRESGAASEIAPGDLDLYQKYTDQMYPQLANQFGVLPKNKVEIKPVEEFAEKGASGASYMPGSPDGKRPGRVQVNTGDFEKRSTIGIETTALHEGVPGHHMQLTIAQEIQGLPDFRQQGGYTAYVEGWALYSERLGEELGFYKDPYSYYGHLQDEMLRAIRLVVDTGLHYKKWNRQQVVDFFHDHSGIEEVEVQSETDRYIVWPGQALGYKIGQLKILELRDYARKELGASFDIRKFHDQVLGAGALPMDVLESHIKDWVATEKLPSQINLRNPPALFWKVKSRACTATTLPSLAVTSPGLGR
jgi:hypothetical protein